MSGLADTTLQLDSGARIPQVGLGVWQTPSGATTQKAVAAALDARLPPRRHRAHLRQRGRRRRGGPGERRRARPDLRHDEAVERRSGLRSRAARVRREPRAARPRLRRPLPHSLARRREAARLLARPRAPPRGRARAFDRRQQLPGAAPRGAAGRGERGPGREPDRADAVPAAARDARALCEARHRRRGVQPAHARAAPRSSGRDGGRAAGGTNARAGAAAVGRCSTAWWCCRSRRGPRGSPRTARCSTSRSTTAR